MDRDNSINILYADMLKQMGIPESKLLPSSTTFHRIVPGKYARCNTLNFGFFLFFFLASWLYLVFPWFLS